MFRRLFALETQALQARTDDLVIRQDQSDYANRDTVRDISYLAGSSSRHGMWASRATA
ncbi:hypothetical protein HN018_05435 [Lichenicola cladoniae]|jgi:hypothetical protein|uniref:Uncharacterized protein n=1 Tax=Lichenicola cladoniae TaxID=1484109 RepID=A0A6M8HMI7_9PROT|nr:hypothetical protein [Lichenicola cladoniae]QKE89562.1 hypothetical protein HN018_05435 [Lichenicola cladoniae]